MSTKILTLAFIVASLLMLLVDNASEYGFSTNTDWTARLYYQLFHASALHWFVNSWALVALMFGGWRMPIHYIIFAYAISCASPSMDIPTVGASGIVYALCGMIVPQVSSKKLWKFLAATAFYLSVGFLFPVNAWLHIYCFIIGSFYGLITSPRIYGD